MLRRDSKLTENIYQKHKETNLEMPRKVYKNVN